MLFFTFFNCIFSIAGNLAAGTVHYFFKECSVFIQQLLLAPEIIQAVLAGKINKSISTEKLKQSLPALWEDRKKMFDIE